MLRSKSKSRVLNLANGSSTTVLASCKSPISWFLSLRNTQDDAVYQDNLKEGTVERDALASVVNAVVAAIVVLIITGSLSWHVTGALLAEVTIRFLVVYGNTSFYIRRRHQMVCAQRVYKTVMGWLVLPLKYRLQKHGLFRTLWLSSGVFQQAAFCASYSLPFAWHLPAGIVGLMVNLTTGSTIAVAAYLADPVRLSTSLWIFEAVDGGFQTVKGTLGMPEAEDTTLACPMLVLAIVWQVLGGLTLPLYLNYMWEWRRKVRFLYKDNASLAAAHLSAPQMALLGVHSRASAVIAWHFLLQVVILSWHWSVVKAVVRPLVPYLMSHDMCY